MLQRHRARGEDLLDALLCDVKLALADPFDLLRILHLDLNAHLHLVPLKREIEKRQLRADDLMVRSAG
jgi:hypothetical protein